MILNTTTPRLIFEGVSTNGCECLNVPFIYFNGFFKSNQIHVEVCM